MDCKHCQEYVHSFKVFIQLAFNGPRHYAECPRCLGWTLVNIEFDPARYGRMTMD